MSPESLEGINQKLIKMGELPYTREIIEGRITIRRKRQSRSYWKKLMETKPGFDRGENG